MCQFCHKHGEGKKWYLQAKNYSEDFMSDIQRRKFIAEFFDSPEKLAARTNSLDQLDKAPGFIKRVIAWNATRHSKKIHFGQVVPIEEIENIIGFTNSVVRLACICRHAARGVEGRYCYGVSMAPDGGEFGKIVRSLNKDYITGPKYGGLETLTKEAAIKSMHAHERDGMCHTVWTFKTPFIGGICNCDRADCLAMKATIGHSMPVMFRAEYVATTNPDLCTGCRACMRVCQFGAIGYSVMRRKSEIDPRRCYGCGICRSTCPRKAISLLDRNFSPSAKHLW
jgi:ferredoxin